MLMEPKPSPFDLRWRMFGIGVRIHPTFWLFSILMGWPLAQHKGMIFLVIWVACTLVSVLFHELGHVIAGRIFGQPGNIILHSFGGLAVGEYQRVKRWQRIVICSAGPAAGFALYGIVVLLDHYVLTPQLDHRRFEPAIDGAIRFFKFMNLLWSVLNLAPVLPLDGGQVMREVCMGINPRQGLRWAWGVSLVAAGLIAVYAGLVMNRNRPDVPVAQHLPWPQVDESHRLSDRMGLDPLFLIIIFALMAVQSFQMLQLTPSGRDDYRDEYRE